LNRSNNLAHYCQRKEKDNDGVGGVLRRRRQRQGIAVVTGGNSGIGAVTVETLALAGMKVILCARNVNAAKQMVEQQLQLVSPAIKQQNIQIQQLDLSDFNSIQQAANNIIILTTDDDDDDDDDEKNNKTKKKKIDVLINNAGVLAPSTKQFTAQEIELTFGVNHVGPHMLTRLLLPHMAKGGRIINVASTAHRMASTPSSSSSSSSSKPQMVWQRENDYQEWREYSDSKLANILFAKRLQELCMQAGRTDISSVSLHPGVIGTNLWRNSPLSSSSSTSSSSSSSSFLQLLRLVRPLVNTVFFDKTVDQGAATTVYCALTERVDGGSYYDNCRVAQTSQLAEDVDTRKHLWEFTEHLIQQKGFTLPETLFAKEEDGDISIPTTNAGNEKDTTTTEATTIPLQ